MSLSSSLPSSYTYRDTSDKTRRERVKDIIKCLISDALDPTPFRVPPLTPSLSFSFSLSVSPLEVTATRRLHRLSRRGTNVAYKTDNPEHRATTTTSRATSADGRQYEQAASVARCDQSGAVCQFDSILQLVSTHLPTTDVSVSFAQHLFLTQSTRPWSSREETKARLFLHLSSTTKQGYYIIPTPPGFSGAGDGRCTSSGLVH